MFSLIAPGPTGTATHGVLLPSRPPGALVTHPTGDFQRTSLGRRQVVQYSKFPRSLGEGGGSATRESTKMFQQQGASAKHRMPLQYGTPVAPGWKATLTEDLGQGLEDNSCLFSWVTAHQGPTLKKKGPRTRCNHVLSRSLWHLCALLNLSGDGTSDLDQGIAQNAS